LGVLHDSHAAALPLNHLANSQCRPGFVINRCIYGSANGVAMSVAYRAVQWLPYKRRYDIVAIGAVVAYLVLFVVTGKLVRRGVHAFSDEILMMRATATCAFLLLNFVLCIGPLARLDRRLLPLLYNRRHLGVLTFCISLVHAVIAFGFYHGFGVISPLRSLLTSNVQYRSISGFPFEILGLIALVILFLMAATSHDFWLKNLSPRVWKWLHMMVYVAWGLLVLHIALGALQSERNPLYAVLLFGIVMVVCSLHLAAVWKGAGGQANAREAHWLEVATVDEIPEGRAKVVSLAKRERIAIFKHEGKLSAVSNLCAHQGGPLGEGRIVGGCITCPWHGYQYRPHDGCSPPPYTEKVPTFAIRVENGRVYLNPEPLEVSHAG
jgi:nitrite reductase/ring-hydroxylating ferredoxin subunit/DMSO/TMAO reductase YedYZ heme-binding membrane subunit